MSLTPGSRLGPYEILGALGAGGMGEVYKARDTRLERLVAVKVLPTAFATDADRLARFEREAKAVAALSHPNILAIFDSGVVDGHAYVITELLDGESLAERLVAGRLPVRKAVEVAVNIARGLAVAHAKGIVHRDLKPANVFLLSDGQVKILDFGLAKSIPTGTETTEAAVTDPGSILGTAGYMAPEQVRGLTVDARTDLFALGAALYEMLTGHRAFKRETPAETLTAILRDDPPELSETLPDLSPTLDRIVRHCLEKNPAERFQTARDVAFALESLSGSGGSASSTPVDQMRPRGAMRGWWFAGVAATLVIAAALAAAAVAGRRSGALPTAPRFTTKTFRRQTIWNARFLPDGHSIVFAAMPQGSVANLEVLRADVVESQRVREATNLYSVSRSGELAVQTSCANVAGGLSCELARMSISGEPRVILEQVVDADWAPDGSMAVARVLGGKYRLEYPIGKALYETPGSLGGGMNSIRVSTDGTRVAFFDHPVQGDEHCSVKIVDRTGTVTTLTGEFRTCSGLAWTPDGSTLLFTAADRGEEMGQIYAVAPAAGSRLRQVVSSAGGLIVTDVAPTGALLALRWENRVGITAKLPGAPAERDLSWLDQSAGPILSSDGAWMLFTDGGAATRSEGPAVLFRRTDGSAPQRLGDGWALDLSPDSKWALAFVPGSPSSFVLYPTGPGEPQKLPNGPIERYMGTGEWFPDGRRVLVCGNEAAHAPRCYSQDMSGSSPKPVTPEGLVGWAISPDGRTLLAQGSDSAWVLVPLEGGPPVAAHGVKPNDIVSGWSKNGDAVFVTSSWWTVPARLERVNLSTGQRTVVTELAPADHAGLISASASSVRDDGRVYAYTYSRVLSTLYQIDGLDLTSR